MYDWMKCYPALLYARINWLHCICFSCFAV